MRRIRILAALALLCVPSLASANGPFSQIIVFGGPLEDMGNFTSVNGDFPPPFFGNRFSDGPLAIEILAEQLGLPLKPSLHLVGPVQGNNFAAVDGLASGTRPQDLNGQIDAYLDSVDGQADPKALYYQIIGGNEVIAATFEPDDAKARELIREAIDAKEQALYRLAAAGARTFLVSNFIDVGITPQVRAAGLAERGSEMSGYHNRLMDRALDRVDHKLRVKLIRHDWASFVNNFVASAKRFGFTNRTESCLAVLAEGRCDFQKFLFFNELFPTSHVHEVWGWALVIEVMKAAGR